MWELGTRNSGCSGAWNPWQTEPSESELVPQRPLVSSPTFLPPRWTLQAGDGDPMPVSQLGVEIPCLSHRKQCGGAETHRP